MEPWKPTLLQCMKFFLPNIKSLTEVRDERFLNKLFLELCPEWKNSCQWSDVLDFVQSEYPKFDVSLNYLESDVVTLSLLLLHGMVLKPCEKLQKHAASLNPNHQLNIKKFLESSMDFKDSVTFEQIEQAIYIIEPEKSDECRTPEMKTSASATPLRDFLNSPAAARAKRDARSVVSRLREELFEAVNENQKLASKLDQLQQKNKDLNNTLADRRTEIALLNENLESTQREAEEARRKILKAELEVSQKNDEIAILAKNLRKLEEDMELIKRASNNKDSEISNLEKENEKLRARTIRCSEEVEALRLKADTDWADKKQLMERCALLERRLEEVECPSPCGKWPASKRDGDTLANEMVAIQLEERTRELRELEDILKSSSDKIEQLQRSLQTTEAKLSDQVQKFNELEKKHAELGADFTATVMKFIAELQATNDERNKMRATFEEERNELNSKLNELTRLAQEKDCTVIIQQKEFDLEKSQLTTQNEEVISRLAKKEEELEQKSATLTEAKEELCQKNRKLMEAEEAIRVYNNRLADAEKEIRLKSSKLAKAEEESRVMGNQFIEVEKQLCLKNSKLEEAEETIRVNEEKLADTRSKLRKAEEEIRNMSSMLTIAEEELCRKDNIIMEAEEATRVNNDKLAEAEEEIRLKNCKYAEAEEEIRLKNCKIAEAEEEIRLKNCKIAEAEEEIRLKNCKLAEAEEEIRLKNCKLAEAEEEIRLKNCKIADAEEEIRLKDCKIADVEDEIRLKNCKLAEAEEEIRLKKCKLPESEEEIRLLSGKLTEAEEAIRLMSGKVADSEEKLSLNNTKLTVAEEQLRLKNGMLTEAEEAIRVYRDKLADAEEEIRLKNNKLTELEENLVVNSVRLTEQENINVAKDKEIALNNLKLVQKEEEIALKDAVISEREVEISDKAAIIEEKNSIIAEKTGIIDEKKSIISDKDRIIAEKNSIIAEKARAIEERDEDVSLKAHIISDKERAISELQNRIAKLQHELDDAKLEAEESLEQQTSIFNDLSNIRLLNESLEAKVNQFMKDEAEVKVVLSSVLPGADDTSVIDRVQRLTAELKRLEEALSQKTSEVDSCRLLLKRSEDELSQRSSELKESKLHLKHSEEALSHTASKVETLKLQVKRLEEALNLRSSELEKCRLQLKRSEETLKLRSSELEESKLQLKCLEETLKLRSSELEVCKLQLERSEETLKLQRSDFHDCKLQLQRSKEALDVSSAEAESLRLKMETFEAEKLELEKSNKELFHKFENTHLSVHAYEEQISRLKNDLSEVMKDRDELKKTLVEFKKNLDDDATIRSNLESEMVELRKKLEDLESERTSNEEKLQNHLKTEKVVADLQASLDTVIKQQKTEVQNHLSRLRGWLDRVTNSCDSLTRTLPGSCTAVFEVNSTKRDIEQMLRSVDDKYVNCLTSTIRCSDNILKLTVRCDDGSGDRIKADPEEKEQLESDLSAVRALMTELVCDVRDVISRCKFLVDRCDFFMDEQARQVLKVKTSLTRECPDGGIKTEEEPEAKHIDYTFVKTEPNIKVESDVETKYKELLTAHKDLQISYKNLEAKLKDVHENYALKNDDHIHKHYAAKLETLKIKMDRICTAEINKIQEERDCAERDMISRHEKTIAEYRSHVQSQASQVWELNEKLIQREQEIKTLQAKQLKLQDKLFDGCNPPRNTDATQNIRHSLSVDWLDRMGQDDVPLISRSRPDRQSLCERKRPEPPAKPKRAVLGNPMGRIEEAAPNPTRTASSGNAVMAPASMGVAFPEEDEDGELFNNTYLADMKSGRSRLNEFQQRNSMCPPHLKSSYPGETQFHDPKLLNEDEIKVSHDGRRLTKDRSQTSYKRPGPPTPSKNGRRLSLQGKEEAKSVTPRAVLQEPNRQSSGSLMNILRTGKTTPSRLRALFASSKVGAVQGTAASLPSHLKNDENEAPLTPTSKRMSIFRKRFGPREPPPNSSFTTYR